jgi:hypothetical protein
VDVPLTAAALQAALAQREPAPGCIDHSDRGSQYDATVYRAMLELRGLLGSMSRRANPYDNSNAESFMKTLKYEAVYVSDYATFDDIARELPTFIGRVHNADGLHSAIDYLTPIEFEENHARQAASILAPLSKERSSLHMSVRNCLRAHAVAFWSVRRQCRLLRSHRFTLFATSCPKCTMLGNVSELHWAVTDRRRCATLV